MSIICRPRERCNKWRECDRCARIRQAKIADVAENRLARNHYLTYVVLTTSEPLTLPADREKLIRSVQRLSSGGLWTVEAGEQFRGLHVNLLLASEKPIKIARIRKIWGDLGEVHAEPVFGWREYWNEVEKKLPNNGRHTGTKPVFTNHLTQLYERFADKYRGQTGGLKDSGEGARNVAAYIAKRSGQPTKEEYSGRIYGTWGTARGSLKSINDLLINEEMQRRQPEIAALALGIIMHDFGVIETAPNHPTNSRKALAEIAASPETQHFIRLPGVGVVLKTDAHKIQPPPPKPPPKPPKPPKPPPPPPPPPKPLQSRTRAEWIAELRKLLA